MSTLNLKGPAAFVVICLFLTSVMAYALGTVFTLLISDLYVALTGGINKWHNSGDGGLFLVGVSVVGLVIGLVIAIMLSYFILHYYAQRVRNTPWQVEHSNIIFIAVLLILFMANFTLPLYFH